MLIFPSLKTEVLNWDIIVIGHLRVNGYFGESADNPPRGDPSTCTSVMVRGTQEDGSPYVLVIDPTIRVTQDAYDFDINRRTGLHLKDVTHCFCTHHHADHYEALRYFPHAAWLAAEGVADCLKNERNAQVDTSRISPVREEFLPGVHAVPLPGHTPTLNGVAFQCGGKKIIVAGDAVMTQYHFRQGTTDFQNDPQFIRMAAATIENLKASCDIVVPGHDNMIVI